MRAARRRGGVPRRRCCRDHHGPYRPALPGHPVVHPAPLPSVPASASMRAIGIPTSPTWVLLYHPSFRCWHPWRARGAPAMRACPRAPGSGPLSLACLRTSSSASLSSIPFELRTVCASLRLGCARRLRSPPVCHVRRGSVPVPCSPPLVVMCSGAQCNTRMKLRIAPGSGRRSGVGRARASVRTPAIFACRLIRALKTPSCGARRPSRG